MSSKASPAVNQSRDVKICYWGTQASEPGQGWGPGVRDHHKLFFVHEGKGTLTIRGQIYNVEAGYGFYTPINEIYQYSSDLDEPWHYSCIGFSGTMIDAILQRTSLTVNPIFDNPPGMDKDRFSQFNELSERPGGDLQMQGVLYELLAALVRQAPATNDAEEERRPRETYVRRAVDFIHRHYDEEVTIRQLSDYLGLDRKYVATLFREALGIPPQQYLLRYRMDKACELLRSTSLSIAETARSVGYKDALLFSRMFKKVVGVPPSRYNRCEQP
ncbi:AraC family transcriptional regulator [Paenibacillus xylaniclasticus]|uniref:AraC family transcriptional regulator n=1 Tax=Paenibacillus xylaniclasticus TaxID=588083 RepID=UPI000FD7021B|nr:MULTISPECIES: AraC family transcriptional regulator [Paenibacillus]GFN33218.1 AraC family transcriptional regulator [Paenibacillus curdlanolyticus]